VSVRWRSRQSAASRGARALTGCLITGAAAARKAAGPCCVSVRQGGSVCELRGEAERGARVRARRRAAALGTCQECINKKSKKVDKPKGK